MMRRSLSVVACFSLLACGNLRAMEKNAAAKKTASIENTAAEKQKNLKLLKEKIEGCDKTFAQIQTLAAGMDKDAAANICIREYQKLFNPLSEAIRDDVNLFFEQLIDYLKDSSKPEPSVQKLMEGVASRLVKASSNYIKESIRMNICLSILTPAIGTDLWDICINLYLKYIKDNTKDFFSNIDEDEIMLKRADGLSDGFILIMKNAAKVLIQAMANELAKNYEIDFKLLGLEEPK